MALAEEAYHLTRSFPADKRYVLVFQMRRAAVSIPSNIAEGQARRITSEFIQFISQAEGSAAELDTQLTLSAELGYCVLDQAAVAAKKIAEIKKMLNALRRALAKPQ